MSVAVSSPFDQTSRRGQILTAALELFSESGYDAVGIDDLGRAVGVTGPAIYRHFGSKQDVLVTLVEEVVSGLQAGAHGVAERSTDPREGLRELVEFHTDFALDQSALVSVYLQERRRLPEDASRSVRAVQRAYLAEWSTLLQRANPDIDPILATETVVAVVALINSRATRQPRLSRDRLRDLLIGLADAALNRMIDA